MQLSFALRSFASLAGGALLLPCAFAQDGCTPPTGVSVDSIPGGAPVTVIYTNFPGAPTNVVPGLGVPFAPGTSTVTFVRPWISADDSQFALEIDADTGSTSDDNCLLLNGALLMQEGTQAPWGAPGELIGTIDDSYGINNAGDILIGNNTTAAANDDYVVLISGGVFTALAQEGGLVDPFLPSLAGATWDDALDTCRLATTGPLFNGDGIDGLAGGTIGDEIQLIPGGFLRESFDAPIGLVTPALWENFTFEEFYVSADGSTYVLMGDTDGATTEDQILTVNNVVVLQEGFAIAGGPFIEPIDSSGIVQAWLDHGGNWYARGNNDVTEQDWVVRNGAVVAFSDGSDPIVPGATEYWSDTDFSDCFFGFDGNSSGAYIIAGVTDAPSDANGVIVYDDGTGNRMVVVRENDPVDIDGDGFYDDDLYFNTFGNDDELLLESGDVIFTATLRNGAGATVCTGIFRVTPGGASCALRNGTGINNLGFDCSTLPVLGSTFTVDVPVGSTTALTFAMTAFAPMAPLPLLTGEVLIDTNAISIPGFGAHNIPLPANPSFTGLPFFMQGFRFDTAGGGTIVFYNAIDAIVGN